MERGDSVRGRYSLRTDESRAGISKLARRALDVLEYLWAFVIILNGNSVYHASANVQLPLLELAVVLTFLLLVTNLVLYRIRTSRYNVLLMVVLLLYCTIYLSIMQTVMNAGVYIKLFVLGAPLMFLLFAELHRRGRLLALMHRFVGLLCVLAVISVIFWYLGSVAKVIMPNMYVEINWGFFDVANGYYGIHFAFQLDTTFFPDAYLFRNSGIFAEAPMFNLWLSIALAIELFMTDEPSRWRCVILALTIVTTLSVTGILFLVLCMVLSAILHYRQMSRMGKGLLLLGAVIAVPILVSVLIKSMTLKSETQSFDMRLSDYIGGVKLWMDYPVFGAGFGNLSAFFPYIYSPEGTVGFSNSIMAVLGTGGMWMALLYYISHIGMLFPRATGSKKLSCFGICMMFLFCTTIFFARFIGVLIVMLGLAIITGPKYTKQ